MRYVNDGEVSPLQSVDQTEELFDIRPRKAARRLIENQHPRFVYESSCDFHDLLLRERKACHAGKRRDFVVLELSESSPRAVPHLVTPQDAKTRHFHTEKQVLGDGEMRRQGQLLMNHYDTASPRLTRARWRVGLLV